MGRDYDLRFLDLRFMGIKIWGFIIIRLDRRRIWNRDGLEGGGMKT